MRSVMCLCVLEREREREREKEREGECERAKLFELKTKTISETFIKLYSLSFGSLSSYTTKITGLN